MARTPLKLRGWRRTHALMLWPCGLRKAANTPPTPPKGAQDSGRIGARCAGHAWRRFFEMMKGLKKRTRVAGRGSRLTSDPRST